MREPDGAASGMEIYRHSLDGSRSARQAGQTIAAYNIPVYWRLPRRSLGEGWSIRG